MTRITSLLLVTIAAFGCGKKAGGEQKAGPETEKYAADAAKAGAARAPKP